MASWTSVATSWCPALFELEAEGEDIAASFSTTAFGRRYIAPTTSAQLISNRMRVRNTGYNQLGSGFFAGELLHLIAVFDFVNENLSGFEAWNEMFIDDDGRIS